MVGRKLNFYALFTLASLLAAVFSVGAKGAEADWRLYGAGNGTKSTQGARACFFDFKTVKFNADGNLKVWTKCLSVKAMDLDKMTAERQEEIIKEASNRLVSKELPPYTKTHKVDKDTLLDIGLNEAIANSGYVDAITKGLLEINCEEKISRWLTFIIFLDGRYKSDTKPDEWRDIPPDTLDSSLVGLVCPAK